MTVDPARDEHRPRAAPGLGAARRVEGAQAPDPLRAGLDPRALFGEVGVLDRRQTLQWLGHLQRLASTGLLAGGMAHDLAGLIQPLLATCDRALLEGDPERHREALVGMRAWARRGEEYVRALLDLVRRDEQHRVAVPVERVVEDTLQLLDSSRRLAGVSLSRSLDDRHVALIDRTRLMQAVVNLVTNAVHAARLGGREVRVAVRGWRGWILVEVEDNGPGVPDEIRGRLFQPFVQAHPASAPHGPQPGENGCAAPSRQGTGLGLYITKRLIEEQGGRVAYETEAGAGTIFRLMLEPAPMDGAPRRPADGMGKGNVQS